MASLHSPTSKLKSARYALALLFFFLLNAAQAQTLYTGHVYDVRTNNSLYDVKVEVKGKPFVATSNTNGDFLLSVENGDSSIQEPTFLNNVMLWKGSASMDLTIVDLSGKTVFSDQVNGEGHYFLPRFENGIYLLEMENQDEKQVYKLFSNGIQTMMVDKVASYYKSNELLGTDTLVFSKEGYYPREIVVNKLSTKMSVKMIEGDVDDLKFFNELIDPVAYEILSSEPYRSHMGGVRTTKLVYDFEEDLMYYVNTKRYKQHFLFVQDALDWDQGNFIFGQTQYRQHDERYMYLGELNHYENQDIYVFQFVASNEYTCPQIKAVYEKILKTSFIGDKLFFFPIKEEWEGCSKIPYITSEKLFEGQNYQPLNLAENYGYLRKVELKDIEETYLGRHDVVIFDGIPNDISVVAGIITTEFQTPLSHINILSHSRSTPNMALRDGWDNKHLEALMGELVYIRVGSDDFELRKASLEEAEAFWFEKEPQKEIFLDVDLEYKELVDMEDADISFINKIGGKAAQFGEIMNVEYDDGKTIPVPENAFAIPFYYYHQHMKTHGLQDRLLGLLKNERFNTDPAYRQAQLKELRESIENASLDPDLVAQVRAKIQNFKEFESFRFRSSTNAEDLEEFSGAGLYQSKSGKKDHDTKTIERAIRRVWASLWDWRAFEERSYFKIQHETCAMGLLVHRSFPDEDANGVILTTNLYNNNPGLVINAQYKEYSIVFPEPGILHDQIMVYTWSIDPANPFTIEYLSFSNVEELNGGRVLTNQEVYEISEYCMQIKKRFFEDLPHSCECEYDDFAVDIEFKIDSTKEDRKVYIKQARLYKK